MKQSEFLEIIELNKGKHRQPIEVLVLGRNGISGEPSKNLKDGKYRFGIASNTWVAGEFSNGILSILGLNYPEYQIINQVMQFNDGGLKLNLTDGGLIDNSVVPRMEAFDNYLGWEILNFAGTKINMEEYSQLPNS